MQCQMVCSRYFRRVLEEIIHTEETYVADLKLIEVLCTTECLYTICVVMFIECAIRLLIVCY